MQFNAMQFNKRQSLTLLATLTALNNPAFAEDIDHLKEVVISATGTE